MKTVNEFKKAEEELVSKILSDSKVFWAFNNEQFDKGKQKYPLAEGEKYISIGAGGYMPASSKETYLQGMKDLKKWKQNIMKAKKIRREHIAYELANHEAYYTGSIEDTLSALGPDYTEFEVYAVYRKEKIKQIKAEYENS